jgi:hypothetical protein
MARWSECFPTSASKKKSKEKFEISSLRYVVIAPLLLGTATFQYILVHPLLQSLSKTALTASFG